MLIMKKWLLAVGILTPFVLYGAYPIWRSLEPLSTEGGPNLSKDEIDKMIKKANEKSASIKVDVEKASKDVLSAATSEYAAALDMTALRPSYSVTDDRNEYAANEWAAAHHLTLRGERIA